jgi:hypothetical protein
MAGLDETGVMQNAVFCCFGRDSARHHEDAFRTLGLV